MKQPVSSDLYVEESGEEGRAIEPGPAEPVDGSIARDEGGGTTVADDSVVVDWALPAIVHSDNSMRKDSITQGEATRIVHGKSWQEGIEERVSSRKC